MRLKVPEVYLTGGLQDILEDLFLDSEVDMVMSGHVHLYARTCSVKKDRCKKKDRGGITHVTVGVCTALATLCLMNVLNEMDGRYKIILGIGTLWV